MGTSPGSTSDADATTGFERYAATLLRHGRRGWLPGVLVDAGRDTVAATDITDRHRRAVLDVTAGVAGPCLVTYVAWVLARAADERIERLYFVAREGEVLIGLARTLQERLGLADGATLRYLHGSRAAWELPAHGLYDGRVVEWLLADAQETTLADLVGRVGIPFDQEVRAAAGVAPERLADHERLRGRAGEATRNLARSPEFLARLTKRAEEARRAALSYLEQEQVFASGAVGFVDTGWSGRQFRALDLLIDAADPSLTRTYFLYALVKVRSDAPPTTRCFVADARRQPFAEAEAARFGELIESFCAGREGSTVGYERRDGRTVPVLARPRNEPALAWGLERYREHLDRYVHAVCDRIPAPGGLDVATLEAAVPALEGVLGELWYRPTPAEARTWGSLRDADHGSADWAARAPRLGWTDLLPWVTNRRWVRWPHAVAVTSPEPLATAIRLTARLLRTVVRIRALGRALRDRLVR